MLDMLVTQYGSTRALPSSFLGVGMLDKLVTQYGSHDVLHPESVRGELKIFNSVVAANSELKQMRTHQLTSHLINALELSLRFSNQTKLVAIAFYFYLLWNVKELLNSLSLSLSLSLPSTLPWRWHAA